MPIVWGTPEAHDLIAGKARALVQDLMAPTLREALRTRTMPDEAASKRIGTAVYELLLDDPEVGGIHIEREDMPAMFEVVKDECLSALRMAFVRLAGEAEHGPR